MVSKTKAKPADSSSEDLPTWNTSDEERERVAELRSAGIRGIAATQRHWQRLQALRADSRPIDTRTIVRKPCTTFVPRIPFAAPSSRISTQSPLTPTRILLTQSRLPVPTKPDAPSSRISTQSPLTPTRILPTQSRLPNSGGRSTAQSDRSPASPVRGIDDDTDHEADDEAEYKEDSGDEAEYKEDSGGEDSSYEDSIVDSQDSQGKTGKGKGPKEDLGVTERPERTNKKWRAFYQRHRDTEIERGKRNYRRRKAKEDQAGPIAIEAGRKKRREAQERYRRKNRALLAQKERERRREQRQS